MRAVAAAIAASAVVALAGCGGGDGGFQALPPGSFISATGGFDPTIHLFGDTVTANARVVVDNRKLDPDRVQLKATFTPYKPVGNTRVRRRTAGNLTEIDYETRLRCLEHECLTEGFGTQKSPQTGAPRSFRFLPGTVLYTDAGTKKPRVLRTIRWGALQEASRINGQDITQIYGFPFRSNVVPLPAATYRVSPVLLAAILLLLAALLLVLPVTLIVRRLRRRPAPAEEPEPELSPLERALGLVGWAFERTDPEERRSALDALATELDAVGDGSLASDARAAGWRPPSPDPDEARRLALRVQEAHGPAA